MSRNAFDAIERQYNEAEDYRATVKQERDMDGLIRQVDRLSRECEVFRAERDHAIACYQNAIRILTAIHSMLYPHSFIDSNWRAWVFKSPLVEEQMQELSDRIRAIPDEIAKIDAAMKEQK